MNALFNYNKVGHNNAHFKTVIIHISIDGNIISQTIPTRYLNY